MPLEICRVAVEVCRLSKVAAGIGNPQAVTDAGIGAILGEAAVVGAALNVRINLGSIKDAAYVAQAAAEIDEIQAEAAALRAEVLAHHALQDSDTRPLTTTREGSHGS